MKQGTGVTVTSMKMEPVSRAVNPGGTDQLGNMVAQNPTPLFGGRGFSAPEPVACTIHPCGSQGETK